MLRWNLPPHPLTHIITQQITQQHVANPNKIWAIHNNITSFSSLSNSISCCSSSLFHLHFQHHASFCDTSMLTILAFLSIAILYEWTNLSQFTRCIRVLPKLHFLPFPYHTHHICCEPGVFICNWLNIHPPSQASLTPSPPPTFVIPVLSLLNFEPQLCNLHHHFPKIATLKSFKLFTPMPPSSFLFHTLSHATQEFSFGLLHLTSLSFGETPWTQRTLFFLVSQKSFMNNLQAPSFSNFHNPTPHCVLQFGLSVYVPSLI